jgi:Alkylmercury lyase
MLLFRSEEHVDKWCKDWRFERGAMLDVDQCWRLAQKWYSADRRDLGWRRFSPLESQNIFQQLGLIGDFWNLL